MTPAAAGRSAPTTAVRTAPASSARGGWVLAFATSTLVFAAIALLVELDRAVGRWDVRLNGWLDRSLPSLLEETFALLTQAGGGLFLLLGGIAAAVLLSRLGAGADALLPPLAFAVTQTTTNGLKLVFERPRPPLRAEGLDVSSYAFPSGHASVSLAVYGAIVIVLARQGASRRAVAGLSAAAVLVVALVACSRVALGAHYLSDTVGGLALGTACLVACTALVDRYGRQRKTAADPGERAARPPA